MKDLQKVTTIKEAEQWFLHNSFGNVIAVSKTKGPRVCGTLGDAIEWIHKRKKI